MLACLPLLLANLASRPAQGGQAIVLPGWEDLSQRWQAAANELGVPGAAWVVVVDGEVVQRETFGQRDVERDLPVTPDSMFYIASTTKTYVATLLALLAEQGKVELDAPVKRYLPRFQLADAVATAQITVRDLLCHRPGLNCGPIVFLDAYTGEITEDRYYHFLSEAKLLGRVDYTNVHFTLAGRVAEAVTGRPWRDALDELVFTPLGMERTTGYATWMYAQEDVALPTLSTSAGFTLSPVRKTDEVMHAAGGLGTSIDDLARWIAFHLGQGELGGRRLLSEKAAAGMLELQGVLDEPDGELRHMLGFGLGWGVGTYRGHRYAQHGGGYVGTAALACFLPDDGIGVGVLANCDGPGQALCAVVTIDALDRFLEDDSGYDPLPGFRQSADRSRAELGQADSGRGDPLGAFHLSLPPEAYQGTYSSEWFGTLVVLEREDLLSARLGILRLELFASGEEEFRLFSPGALDSTGRFVIEGGRVVAVEFETRDRPMRFERRDG